jgi:hypothetical protein
VRRDIYLAMRIQPHQIVGQNRDSLNVVHAGCSPPTVGALVVPVGWPGSATVRLSGDQSL